MQWALHQTWGQVISAEFTNTLRQEKGKITPCSKLYCCSPIHFCTQTGVRPWLMYLRSILDVQFSTGNPMFLRLFRFQGSLGSAQSCGMFRDYCQHSIVKLTNLLCSLVSSRLLEYFLHKLYAVILTKGFCFFPSVEVMVTRTPV